MRLHGDSLGRPQQCRADTASSAVLPASLMVPAPHWAFLLRRSLSPRQPSPLRRPHLRDSTIMRAAHNTAVLGPIQVPHRDRPLSGRRQDSAITTHSTGLATF
jgi:hypothetical protein